MRLWTMLAGLLVAGVMVNSVYAQGEGKKKGEGKRGPMLTFKDIAGSDEGKATEELYVKARTKNASEDKKEAATTRAKAFWKRLAGDKAELNKDEYEAAVNKMREEFKSKGGKKEGEGKRGPMLSFKDIVGSDDGKMTEELYVKARTKNAPEDKKEAATTRAKASWKRLAGDKAELTKDEFDAAVKKRMEERKSKGGKKEA
jgi:hypothetical protein